MGIYIHLKGEREMGQATSQRGTSTIVRINDLGQRLWALERNVDRQARAIDYTLDRLERLEKELKARVRTLEEELTHQ
jgi:hypothetical protein